MKVWHNDVIMAVELVPPFFTTVYYCIYRSYDEFRLKDELHRLFQWFSLVLLRVSALHYSAGDWVSEGFLTVASAHALHQPTSCRSEYFYNQRPQVQNLIGTEHSLNRSEHRVKREAS